MTNHISNAVRAFDVEIAALEHGKKNIGASFAAAVELIRSCAETGRVIVMGMGKSGHIGNKIAATMSSTGTPTFFVHPAEAGHGDLGMITKNDVVIAISQSGKSDEILRVMPYVKRNGIKLIAMTGVKTSPLAQYADIVIDTEVPQEACPLGLAPTASTTLTLALGDALAVSLLQARGFTQEDFAQTHPHGALGRRLLLSVSDVMSDIDRAPVISHDVVIKDALLAMTNGEMGFVIVIDGERSPVGVFTDGDLRRSIDKSVDLNNTKITTVMKRDFITILSNRLAVEAVELMEKNKISALPVLDDDAKLVGAINMRQLLQAGVL